MVSTPFAELELSQTENVICSSTGVSKLLLASLTLQQNKLECLSLTGIFSLRCLIYLGR
jgi:hypothetical protein